jgi:hypothetical protein
MDNRKSLINEYKQRKIIGGIYKITNTSNQRYLLDYSANIQATQNSFDFMVTAGYCSIYKLKQDFQSFGPKAFTFEVIETLEKKKEQTQQEFEDDLSVLKQIWSDKLDSAKRY